MGKNKKRQRNKKDNNVDEVAQLTVEKATDEVLTMTVKSGTKVENMLKFARKALQSGEHRRIVWTGSGQAITRTISCAESLRREFQVHQVTEVSQEIASEGKTSDIPSIRILQSLEKIDPLTPGYQSSEGGTAFWLSARKSGEQSSEASSHGRFAKRRKVQECGESAE
ncbi:ribonuclease P protein subunit p25 [Phlebotomus argentipes]|uniref:ribonuclease P protein subunit p25 n=1 Tax=Phlebotomus argentipes TaxID=94469 RepID=UPI002892F308|nr:ribonuclease P protein subunit p25 [Phlebotomus argentipes]